MSKKEQNPLLKTTACQAHGEKITVSVYLPADLYEHLCRRTLQIRVSLSKFMAELVREDRTRSM